MCSGFESWIMCTANIVPHSLIFKTTVLLFCFYFLQLWYLFLFSLTLVLIFF